MSHSGATISTAGMLTLIRVRVQAPGPVRSWRTQSSISGGSTLPAQ
jgi:hypothetical protein